jgi:hypothetical protein
MKDKTIRFLLVANLVAMLLLLGTQMLRPAPAEAQSRVKWEYKVVEVLFGQNTEAICNKLGNEGWEHYSSGSSGFYFKRRKN